MEIEKKYLIKDIPFDYEKYDHKVMSQGYISVSPVIRIRQANEKYILTIKSKGLLAREEHEIFISKEEYDSLAKKVDGNVIEKVRYLIPLNETDGTTGNEDLDKELMVELDVFKGAFSGLIYAEVEFPSEAVAEAFAEPNWFYKEVTYDNRYHNSSLSSMDINDVNKLFS